MQSRILLNINYATTINKLSGNLITRWFFVGKTENSVKVLILFFEKHTMSEAAIPVIGVRFIRQLVINKVLSNYYITHRTLSHDFYVPLPRVIVKI